MMLHIFNRSVYRKPVGMHVQGRHEHREHHGFLLEILPFEGALHCHYATVDRAYHHPHALAAVMTLRATEKIEDEAIDYRGKDTEACRNQNRRHKEPYRHIKRCQYHNGRFLSAYLPKASIDNERSTVGIKADCGKRITVRQIAGAMARRIVTYARKGEEASVDEHLGFIKFGSRVDIYLPVDCEILVKIGDITRGGVTPVARFKS